MLIKPEIACAIIEGIASVRADEELQDFVVETDGKDFKCHRLILSACSGFFRGLLRSGMKESQKQKPKLEDVSKETFTAILDTLYTGSVSLTRDNMLNVWLAADQLQIKLIFDICVNFIANNICDETVISVWKVAFQVMHKNIIELCETFLRSNISLDNWEIIYLTANMLKSNLILSQVRDFIKKNYDQVIKSKAFLSLREKDLLKVIESQDLVVTTEDVVIESILNWVNNGGQVRSETMAGDWNENADGYLSEEEGIEEEQEEAEELEEKEQEKEAEKEHEEEEDLEEEEAEEEQEEEEDLEEAEEEQEEEEDLEEAEEEEAEEKKDKEDKNKGENKEEEKEGEKNDDDQNPLLGHLISGGHRAIIAKKPKYSQKHHEKFLEPLLTKSRLCLVNSVTLDKLSRDALVMSNKKTKEMVMNALLYKSIGRQHGVWLKSAVYRNCSGLENVAILGLLNGTFYALSCRSNFKWFFLLKRPYLATCTSVNVIAYMTNFFAIGEEKFNESSLCMFFQNEWREVKKLSGNGWLGVAIEEFIYLINSSNQQIQRFDPRFGNSLLEDLISFPTQDKIEHVCSFDLFILAFCSVVVKEVKETVVHCLDTRSKTWTRLNSLEGSAENICSIRKERQFYILQTNGNLWEMNRDEINGVHLKLSEVIWKDCRNEYGVFYMNDHLCFVTREEKPFLIKSKLFGKIQAFTSNEPFCNVIVPAVIKSEAYQN